MGCPAGAQLHLRSVPARSGPLRPAGESQLAGPGHCHTRWQRALEAARRLKAGHRGEFQEIVSTSSFPINEDLLTYFCSVRLPKKTITTLACPGCWRGRLRVVGQAMQDVVVWCPPCTDYVHFSPASRRYILRDAEGDGTWGVLLFFGKRTEAVGMRTRVTLLISADSSAACWRRVG